MALDMSITVLIVEDTGIMRRIFFSILMKVGYLDVIMAVDGLDALEKLASRQVGLVISDWNMPNLDGLGLLRKMRQDERFKNIPFIMATAQADKSKVAAAMEAGANAHIAKPFDENEIKARIEEVFGEKTAAPAPEQERQVAAGKVRLKVGHIQVTDHLALGVLQHQIAQGEVLPRYFELETVCLPGWNPVQDALEKGELDGALVLAPIAMDLFAFGVEIRLILLAHKNGSSFVRSVNLPFADFGSEARFYKYRAVNIPHKMSIHHLLAHQYLTELGLKPGVPGGKPINVRFEVVPPVQMPAIMKDNDEVAGFIVAEPIASNAISQGVAELQFVSASCWQDHPCCVVAMRQQFLEKYPEAAHEFTALLVAAGRFVEAHKAAAAEIAVSFLDPAQKLGLRAPIVQQLLEDPLGITMHDLYPVMEDFDRIQRYMHDQMGIGRLIDLEKFVDLRFADAVYR